MLITNKFVMINYPKTGSTFARKVLMDLHRPSWFRAPLERLGLVKPTLVEHFMLKYFFTEEERQSKPDADQHGCVVQIPEQHKGKLIMSVMRDPEARIISSYEFKHWQRFPFPSREAIQELYPHFPDLSFAEYMNMRMSFAHLAQPPGVNVDIGPMTTQFIRFFAHDPLTTIRALRDDTDLTRDWDLHFPRIRFLHTENLNQELHDFLLDMGYDPKRITSVLDRKKENTTPRSRKTYLTPAMRDVLHYQERFLYQIFPEYVDGHGT